MKSTIRTAFLATVAVAAMGLFAAFTPPAVVLDQIPALNTAGDHVYASANISDGTGVVTTVTTATTYVTVGTAAPLAAGEADGSGCITYTLASNKFTIAKRCGAGPVKLTACLNDIESTHSKTMFGAWHRVRAGVTTQQGPIIFEDETDTTAVRNSLGCSSFIHDAALSDTFDFRFDKETNGNTVTTRQASFMIEKLRSDQS